MTALHAQFADLVARWVTVAGRIRARRDPAVLAEAVRLGNADADPEAAARILTPERLAALVPEATAARVEALADVLARDAEAVCAALVPEEDRAAVLAELEVDYWPTLVNATGEHGWFAGLNLYGTLAPWWAPDKPTARSRTWLSGANERMAAAVGLPPDRAPTLDGAIVSQDGRAWPSPTVAGSHNYELDLATLPPESTRPWLSTVGAVLVTDAHWRVRPEHGALWTLGRLAGGTLARDEHEAAARWALTTAGEEQDAGAITELAGQVHTHAGKLARLLREYPTAQLADTSAGLLRADRIAGDFLAELGTNGAEDLDRSIIRAREHFNAHQDGAALDLWRLWRPEHEGQPCARLLWDVTTQRDHEGAPPVLLNLALVLWLDKVKDARRWPAPMITRLVHDPVFEARTNRGPLARVRTDEDARALWREDLDSPMTLARMARLWRNVQTTAGALLWRWMLEQARLEPRAEVIGGVDELARRLGLNSGKSAAQLRDAMRFFDGVRLPINGYKGRSGLVQINEEAAAPGRRGRLVFVFSDPIRPYYFRELKTAHHTERRIVPVLSPADRPPPVLAPGAKRGNPADVPNLYALQDLVVAEMADKSPELYEHGGVRITPGRWFELQREAGLRASVDHDALMEAWSSPGGKDLFPVVQTTGPDRYRLAYDDAHACVLAIGEYRRKQRAKRKNRGKGKSLKP